MKMKSPMHILEVGTAIGFSALLMSEYAPQGCRITTIEKYEKRIPLAIENFKKAGKEDSITLLQGDALEILPTLAGEYDFIFMDAAKGQYIHFLPDILINPLGAGMSFSGSQASKDRIALTEVFRTCFHSHLLNVSDSYLQADHITRFYICQ